MVASDVHNRAAQVGHGDLDPLGGSAARQAAIFWVIGLVLLLAAALPDGGVTQIVRQAAISGSMVALLYFILVSTPRNSAIPYLLFFSISFTSLFGITKTLTGSHAVSTNILVYGLSFYTATLAYHYANRDLNIGTGIHAANPMLLFTGPIATLVTAHRTTGLRRRAAYYLPFALIGAFFYKIIAAPLGLYLWMIDYTEPIRALQFAFIFELFVYFNFAGLSLLVFGVLGVIGLRVPLNFRQPFSARNLIDFWKGWHISLSTVLKTLFYTPTRAVLGSAGALFVVYISSALWHGVTFNFVLWGAFHAATFWATIHLLKARQALLATFLMIFAVVYGRMLFADSDTARLLSKLAFWAEHAAITVEPRIPRAAQISLVLAVLLVAMEFLLRDLRLFRQRCYKYLRTPAAQIVMILLFALLIQSDGGADYAVYGQR